MVPEELRLRNFLSHRETDLDFRGIHLAALVGENGAGKSALLDAITWAVWGRSRAPYGREEDLVYHGESDIEVELVFRMPYQGGTERRCRILRRRELRGRRSTTATLDFQIQAEEGWRSLTADSIRDTQARIVEQLGLDYDTFINSAYLRQGHADEFTVQSPAQRKRVLSAVLGLDAWAELQARARSRLATVQGQLKATDRRLDEMTLELERRPVYEAALAQAEAQVVASEALLAEAQAQVDALNRVQEQAAVAQRQIAGLEPRIAQESESLAALQAEEELHRGQLAYDQALLEQASEIEGRYQAYRDALAEERAWGEKLGQAARMQQEKAGLEEAIAAARTDLAEHLRALEQHRSAVLAALSSARAALEKRASDLRGQSAVLAERVAHPSLLADLAQAEAALARLTEAAQERDSLQAAQQAFEVEQSRLNERNTQLRTAMSEVKTRQTTLAGAGATCPVCGQTLSREHHHDILEEIESQGRAMGDEFRVNKGRLEELQQLRADHRKRIQDLDLLLRNRGAVEQKAARLQQQAEQSDAASRRVEELASQIAELDGQIAAEDYGQTERAELSLAEEQISGCRAQLEEQAFAPEARAALAAVLGHLMELGYDQEAHRLVRQRLVELGAAEADYRELEKARIGMLNEAAALQRLEGEIAAQQRRLAQTRTEWEALKQTLATLQPQLAEGQRVVRQLYEARQAEALARQRVGAARQEVAALDTLQRRLEVLRGEREGLSRDVGVFSELQEAFGVNGIPAMIIEHTLPEFEREANRTLERLSGGRMHLRFDTQRETKTGNLRETLDIIISDEKGTRPYENFSGGEQFRINFALRVALSRILAQRSGVRLRSLFVDEGFGSLDTDGRQRLVEAVKAVQSDFDLIIVITHIDELREAFPTQIQVTKSGSGSQVDVI